MNIRPSLLRLLSPIGCGTRLGDSFPAECQFGIGHRHGVGIGRSGSRCRLRLLPFDILDTLAEDAFEVFGEDHFLLQQQLGQLRKSVSVFAKHLRGERKGIMSSRFTSLSISSAVCSL